jgi:peptidoglycan/LPS O-acetylase OafA/YrhL
VLGSGSDPFQPSVIPFNVGAIACGYLAGVALVRPWRSRRTKAMVLVGSDDAYGIYLSQMLFITALTWLGWGKLTSTVPWPLLCLATVGIVFACSIALTGLLARTPLAIPLTGRQQVPWSGVSPPRWWPRGRCRGSRPADLRPSARACEAALPRSKRPTASESGAAA